MGPQVAKEAVGVRGIGSRLCGYMGAWLNKAMGLMETFGSRRSDLENVFP